MTNVISLSVRDLDLKAIMFQNSIISFMCNTPVVQKPVIPLMGVQCRNCNTSVLQ